MLVVAHMMYDTDPKGSRFSEDPETLARLYPELWKRFATERPSRMR